MAVSDSDYEGGFQIPAPKGIYQAEGDTNLSVNYAYRAQNIRTERGLLASAYGTKEALPSAGAAIETLTRFPRRNNPEAGEVFVAAAGGAIYTIPAGGTAWTKRGEGFLSNSWSTVIYETAKDGATVDVLILSNAKDGMVALYGDDLTLEEKTLALGEGYANVKFAVLGRYAERIWGTGAEEHPDSLFYSRPYDPFTWTDVPETPELGGGMIQQPTWDGDSFLSLQTFGGYLLAIKRNTVFEVRGTDPGSFTISEAYGSDGPMLSRSICVDRTSMLFLTRGDIGLYDGSTLRLLARNALHETMRMLGGRSGETAAACMCNHVYYLALCVKENENDVIQENNAVIEYDTERGTFMLRRGMRVKAFCGVDGEVYYADAQTPFTVRRYNAQDAPGYGGTAMQCLWETAWLDLGKRYMKREFELRFTADADEDDFPLEVTVQTEKREKTRVVLLQKDRRDYRVKMHLKGMRVKLRIASGSRPAGWRIYGGVEVRYTLDEA